MRRHQLALESPRRPVSVSAPPPPFFGGRPTVAAGGSRARGRPTDGPYRVALSHSYGIGRADLFGTISSGGVAASDGRGLNPCCGGS
jgi:hypothetical protein